MIKLVIQLRLSNNAILARMNSKSYLYVHTSVAHDVAMSHEAKHDFANII